MASYSLAVTPHSFSISGAPDLKPYRLPVARRALSLTGGFITMGKNLGLSSSDLGALKLDRLNRAVAIVDNRGLPVYQFQLFLQRTMEAIERAYTALATNVTDLSAVVEGITQAQAAASAAQSTATAAAVASAQQSDLQRTRDSYVNGSPLTSTNDGGVASIAIAAHDRNYLDPAVAVPVSSGLVTGLAASTAYYVYYDDPAFAGGSVSYQVTTVAEAAAASQAFPTRHSFPAITTPATSGGGTVGDEPPPPQWKYERELL